MEQDDDDTAAWASAEDVREYTARADVQLREVLGRVLAQRRSVEIAFGYLTALSPHNMSLKTAALEDACR